MSDDDNVIEFGGKEAVHDSIENRVISCMTTPDCQCKYCKYYESATNMVVDFLSRDISAFENNTKSKCCTYDVKRILFKAILKVKDMENEIREDRDK